MSSLSRGAVGRPVPVGQPPRARSRSRGGSAKTLGLAVSLLLLFLAIALSLAIGTKELSLGEVFHALVTPGSSYADTVIDSRIPRTILGVMVGASLAVSGALMQGITRNPLGDPGLFGINAGAAAAIVTGLAVGGIGVASGGIWLAFAGALCAVVAVFMLGSTRTGATPLRLVLAGAVISAVLAAYIQAIALSMPAVFESYRFWVVGSLAGRDPAVIVQVLPFMVIGLLIALGMGPRLNATALGDDAARSLGSSPEVTRVLGAVAATLLSAAATAAVGPIAFVGLAVPHIIRSFTGDDYRWIIGYSLVLGPALLLFSDVLGRVIVRPGELMVGVVTAFVGTPILLIAVRRMRG